jgi:hypothetical protein
VKTIIVAALALLTLAGCTSAADKEAQQDRSFSHGESALATAQRNATVACRDREQCDKAWALTKNYVAQHSDTDVVRADDVAIDTDVPTRGGRASFSATRVKNGAGATITLYAQCRGMYGQDNAMGSDYNGCVTKIRKTQDGFADFLNEHLSGR